VSSHHGMAANLQVREATQHHAETRDPPSQDPKITRRKQKRYNDAPVVTSKQTTATPRRNSHTNQHRVAQRLEQGDPNSTPKIISIRFRCKKRTQNYNLSLSCLLMKEVPCFHRGASRPRQSEAHGDSKLHKHCC